MELFTCSDEPAGTTTADSAGKPALVMLHFLGGSGREWDEVVALLGNEYKTLRIDLPGFGGSAGVPGYSVVEMADLVHATITAAKLERYVLIGHSMGGKVAAVLARRAQDASDRRLRGLVLVAPSPPGPEPMGDEKRSMMLGLLSERHDDDRARARSYITKNESRHLPPKVEQRASSETLRMNRTAWTAWLMQGSKEDWSGRVGVLELPALIVAGDLDRSLGPKQQAELTLPHLRRGQLRTIENCSHLIPMECPALLVDLLRKFLSALPAKGKVPAQYLSFLESGRVSPKTREVLEARMETPSAGGSVLTATQTQTLRAMLARIVPQRTVDVAPYVLERLAEGKGNGWRYDVLPGDLEAYREGLDRLAEVRFAELSEAEQDAALDELAAVKGSAEARWFEEVRGDAVSAYMAHPATLARLGYSGIGVGGATTKYKGYLTLGPNQREDWEPMAEAEAAR